MFKRDNLANPENPPLRWLINKIIIWLEYLAGAKRRERAKELPRGPKNQSEVGGRFNSTDFGVICVPQLPIHIWAISRGDSHFILY